MPKSVITMVEDVPMFHATFGEHNEKAALKVTEAIEHPRDPTPNYQSRKGKKS
jgi:flagellar motor switch protein FliM